MTLPKKNKFSAQKARYGGIEFDSRKECRRWIVLCDMQKKGEISDLRRQVPYLLQGRDGHLIGDGNRKLKYIADFIYRRPDGDEVVEDAKGFKTPEYRLKKAVLRAQGITIREV